MKDEIRFQAERGDYGTGDLDKLMEEVTAHFSSDEAKSYERALPGGRTLQFNVAPTPEGGNVTIATDITERKQAERELAEKEALLRLVFDNIPGAIIYTDKDLNQRTRRSAIPADRSAARLPRCAAYRIDEPRRRKLVPPPEMPRRNSTNAPPRSTPKIPTARTSGAPNESISSFVATVCREASPPATWSESSTNPSR